MFGISDFALLDQVDFHSCPERYLSNAKSAASMPAVVAKNLHEQFRSPVGHKMLLGKCRCAVDQHHQLDDSLDLVQIADG